MQRNVKRTAKDSAGNAILGKGVILLTEVAMDRNYEDLIQAIAVQAARDYRKALRLLIRNPRDREAKCHKDEIEVFFRSQWFCDITTADGEFIIQALQKEVSF